MFPRHPRLLPALLLTALGLCLPLRAAPLTVGLWRDPDLQPLSPTPAEALPALLSGPDRQVVPLRTADLLDPTRLDPTRLDCLVVPSGAYPAAGGPALRQFRERGGALLLLAGNPFDRLLFPTPTGWAALDDFPEELRPLAGSRRWDTSSTDAPDLLKVTGDGTKAAPYVFATPNLTAYQYAACDVGELPATAAGLVFEVRGGMATTQLCLEGNEQDGSRWKQIVPVTPHWREVRLHLASFCAYATPGRGAAGDYLHPERLRKLSFGLFRYLVPEGAHRFEIRNLRFMAATVPPATAAGVALPGRPTVERFLGTAVAPGPAADWPRLFSGTLPGEFPDLRPAAGSLLTDGLRPLRGPVSSWTLEPPPTYADTRLFPPAARAARFVPLLTSGGPDPQLAAALSVPARGGPVFALGLTGADLSTPDYAALSTMLARVLDLLAAGAVLHEAGPQFRITDGLVEAVWAQPLSRRGAAADATVLGGRLETPNRPAREGQVPLGATAPEWLRRRLDQFDWRQFTTTVELRTGDTVRDRVGWQVDARATLRDLCDFLGQAGAEDGKFSGVYFIDSRGARTLLAGYELFRRKAYLDTARRWARTMAAEQRPDGGYRMGYGITRKGEECYVADGGEIALGVARVAAYAPPAERKEFIASLRRYMAYRDSFRCPEGGIGVGWCLSDYGKRPVTPLAEVTRILAPEQNTYTIGCTLAAAWAYARLTGDEDAARTAVADGAWLTPRAPSLSGAAAESYVYAHALAADREPSAAQLRAAFVEKIAARDTEWWVASGGRAALDLHTLGYCYEALGRDPRLLRQMARAVSAMTARQSPTSFYRLLGRDDLRHDEWLYLCFGGLGLAEVLQPGVTLPRPE